MTPVTDQMTATEVREKVERASEMMEFMTSAKLDAWQRELVKTLHQSASNLLPPSLKPVMTNIIDRIKMANHDLHMQNLRTGSLYLGQHEWAELRSEVKFISDLNDEPHRYMGYSVYIVMQKNHFVLTGE